MELTSEQVEEQLRGLTPAPLSHSLLDCLDQAMAEEVFETEIAEEKILVSSSDPELAALEDSLRGLVPYGVPEDMIARLDLAMSRWHEDVPESEKVITLYPEENEGGRSSWIGFRSVAAVGLLGIGVAFLTGESSPSSFSPSLASQAQRPLLSGGATTPAVFTPGGARSSVVAANDYGVVWTKGGNPVRCTEVQVSNEIEFVNQRGERLIIEQPKREVRFTTVKFD